MTGEKVSERPGCFQAGAHRCIWIRVTVSPERILALVQIQSLQLRGDNEWSCHWTLLNLIRAFFVAQLVKNLQCRKPGFDPWVGKIPWRRERLPTPVFWPGEFHGLYSPWARKESDRTEWLSLSLFCSYKVSRIIPLHCCYAKIRQH